MGKNLWQTIRKEAEAAAKTEPVLAGLFQESLLSQPDLAGCIGMILSHNLGNCVVGAEAIRDMAKEAFAVPAIIKATEKDLEAVFDRDPACRTYLHALFFTKGFQALQAYRLSHYLWMEGRHDLALYLQKHISDRYSVDIHPAAEIEPAVMLDHASGLVIGETCKIGAETSILQNVTLGGTGKESGDRHPKIGRGVLISAGAIILGNITIGDGAKIGAGSVVLDSVPPHSTAVGVPAKVIGKTRDKKPGCAMNQNFQHSSGQCEPGKT